MNNIEKEKWKNKLLVAGMKKEEVEMCSCLWDIWEKIKSIDRLIGIKDEVEKVMVRIENDIKEGKGGSNIVKMIEKIINDIEVMYHEDIKLRKSYEFMYGIIKEIYDEINNKIKENIKRIKFGKIEGCLIDSNVEYEEIELFSEGSGIKKEELINEEFQVYLDRVNPDILSNDYYITMIIKECYKGKNEDNEIIWNINGIIDDGNTRKWEDWYSKITLVSLEKNINLEEKKIFPISVCIEFSSNDKKEQIY